MPTATEFFGMTITNFGPLTTTYTPPPSCTTVTTDHIHYAVENVTGPFHGSPSCKRDSVGDCIPKGSSYDPLESKQASPWELGFVNYHSPGIYCPKGWTTAAVLGHGENTGSQVRSGVFTNARIPGNAHSLPSILQPDEIWLRLLEPSETLAYCCPITCVTFVEPFSSSNYTDLCVRRYDPPLPEIATVHTVEGESVSGTAGVLSAAPWTGTWSDYLERLTDFLPDLDRTSSLIVVRTLPAVPLVYKSLDVEDAKTSTGDDDGGKKEPDGDDDEGGAQEVDENGSAASNLSSAFGLAPLVAVLAGVFTVLDFWCLGRLIAFREALSPMEPYQM